MGGKTTLTKGDKLIIALVLLAALAGFIMLAGWRSAGRDGLNAEIFVDGQLFETIALDAGFREIELESNGGYNLLHISPEGICMLEADCYNQDCVKAGLQGQPGSMIACLPNRVLVRLSNNITGGVDAIAY